MLHLLLELVVLAFPISEIALGILRRARGPRDTSVSDRGSMRLLWIVILGSVTVAAVLSHYHAAAIHASHAAIDAIALVLLIGGLALRWVSIIVLGRFFTVNVAILDGHHVVDTGPYRFVRHPSYTGLLVAFAGLGLYFMNWLSFAITLAGILPALLYRIRIEEAALNASLGEAYAAYSARTKRLIPGLL
ncbi:MAG TPA: isoprenylcysteine carboxylmethyltransferase family protein [Candidatus Krumholzibacteria bacterium]|nr:isoprenylcysteine carboxylmethyltransferase family protein [Candidatus Krumholzibacteria bacterium]